MSNIGILEVPDMMLAPPTAQCHSPLHHSHSQGHDRQRHSNDHPASC